MDGVVTSRRTTIEQHKDASCVPLILIGWCLIVIGVEEREWKRVSLGERFKSVIRIALRSSTEERLDALCRRCRSIDGLPDRGYLFGRA